MAASLKYADLSDSIMSGCENICKWYRKTDDTDAYFVCLGSQIFTLHGISADILLHDLNVKAAYAQNRWALSFFKDGMHSLEKVVSDLGFYLLNVTHLHYL